MSLIYMYNTIVIEEWIWLMNIDKETNFYNTVFCCQLCFVYLYL